MNLHISFKKTIGPDGFWQYLSDIGMQQITAKVRHVGRRKRC